MIVFAYSRVSNEKNRKKKKIDVIFQAINVCAILYAIVPATIMHIRIDVQKGEKKERKKK
jgi:hypothetical protein